MATIRHIKFNGKIVPVVGDDVDLAIKSPIFQRWIKFLDVKFKLKKIEFQSVDALGIKGSRRVLFLKFKAMRENEQGKLQPEIVFMRGGAVSVLIVLNCQGKKYTIITRQARFASGYYSFPEIPAGMIDDGDCISSRVISELEDETGLKVPLDKLVDMTKIVYGDRYPGVLPSPGACDEFIRYFLYESDITKEELDKLQGKATGRHIEGEFIRLKVVLLADLIPEAPDSKALSALALYNYIKS